MTRKLFAFLALLSGLAALSVPAAASYSPSSSSCDASVSAAADQSASDKQAQGKRQPGKTTANIKGSKSDPRTPRPRSLRLPVLMGIERAYE